jgi:hypothetical protein
MKSSKREKQAQNKAFSNALFHAPPTDANIEAASAQADLIPNWKIWQCEKQASGVKKKRRDQSVTPFSLEAE